MLLKIFFARHATMQLGVLAQHPPRVLRAPRLAPRVHSARLPSAVIVTPSFNTGKFLEATILSVLDQADEGVAYGVVDGGSTDGSAEIVKRYSPRLAWAVSEPDRGQTHAIQKGFQRLDGEVMAYLNADDILLPGALAFVRSFFARHPDVDAVYGHRLVIDADGQQIGRWILPPHNPALLRLVDFVPQETLFWRRRIFEAAGGMDVNFDFAMDWDLLLRMQDVGARIVRLPHFFACFRHHPSQKTVRMFDTVGAKECALLAERSGSRPEPSDLDAAQLHAWVCDVLLRIGIRI
jgi:glycosyltransferase involved in cell wall biosynthesis